VPVVHKEARLAGPAATEQDLVLFEAGAREVVGDVDIAGIWFSRTRKLRRISASSFFSSGASNSRRLSAAPPSLFLSISATSLRTDPAQQDTPSLRV